MKKSDPNNILKERPQEPVLTVEFASTLKTQIRVLKDATPIVEVLASLRGKPNTLPNQWKEFVSTLQPQQKQKLVRLLNSLVINWDRIHNFRVPLKISDLNKCNKLEEILANNDLFYNVGLKGRAFVFLVFS